MALLKAVEVRQMTMEDRTKKIDELRMELMHERGVAAMGGSPPSPGKIRQLRTAIARLLTIQNQERSGHIQYGKGEKPRAAGPVAAKKAPARKAKKPAAKKSEASKAPAAKPAKAAAKKPKKE